MGWDTVFKAKHSVFLVAKLKQRADDLLERPTTHQSIPPCSSTREHLNTRWELNIGVKEFGLPLYTENPYDKENWIKRPAVVHELLQHAKQLYQKGRLFQLELVQY